jgi:hypothetical protein
VNDRVETQEQTIERWKAEQHGARVERQAVVEYLRREAKAREYDDEDAANLLREYAHNIEKGAQET